MADMYKIKDPEDIILRDYLARDRTSLAAERTFLAYMRTALGFFSAGVALIKITPDIPWLYIVGIIMLISAPFFLVQGVLCLYKVKKKISSIPDNHLISNERDIWMENHPCQETENSK